MRSDLFFFLLIKIELQQAVCEIRQTNFAFSTFEIKSETIIACLS